MDDLLASTDGGKHDYDWLLTPPGTPLYPSADRNELQQLSVAPRSIGLGRSVSTTKGSRLAASQPESNRPCRPTRSSSVTRSSVSTTQFNTYSNKSTSILNTSSSSVSSYIRPSTPNSRSSSAARPSTPSSRPVVSRSSTPSRGRPSPASSSLERPRPVHNSRPSTPTSRPQIPAASNIPSTRQLSRPSTPTRRSSAPSLSPAPSSPAPRSLSRPSSPSPRVKAPPQPISLPDFSLETPPNLRTTLSERPLSAGRSRPARGKEEFPSPPVNVSRRPASPAVSRGRVESPSRGRLLANGQGGDMREIRKVSNGSEALSRKPVRPSATPVESTGFGRNISKKSLDMAIRHMDIKNGTAGTRPLSGTTRFPQSIRSTNPKGLAADRSLNSQASANGNSPISNNGNYINDGNYFTRSPENGIKEENRRLSAKLAQLDMYESSRYDTILLKEDLNNTNWLLSVDDKSDHIFEPLPELFDP